MAASFLAGAAAARVHVHTEVGRLCHLLNLGEQPALQPQIFGGA